MCGRGECVCEGIGASSMSQVKVDTYSCCLGKDVSNLRFEVEGALSSG